MAPKKLALPTDPEAKVLRALFSVEPASAHQVAAHMGIHYSSAVQNLNSLHTKRLVSCDASSSPEEMHGRYAFSLTHESRMSVVGAIAIGDELDFEDQSRLAEVLTRVEDMQAHLAANAERIRDILTRFRPEQDTPQE